MKMCKDMRNSRHAKMCACQARVAITHVKDMQGCVFAVTCRDICMLGHAWLCVCQDMQENMSRKTHKDMLYDYMQEDVMVD